MPNYERRSISATLSLETRGKDLPTIVGHAAVFDQVTDLGYIKEQVAPGAFTRTLAAGGAVYALWNHDPSFIVASTKNGSLRLSEDKIGLRAEMDPMDTPTIRDLVVKPIQDGVVDKMSFGFSVADNGDEIIKGVRVLRDLDLFDVSPVTFPAYPGTDISARAWSALMRAEIDPAEFDSFMTSLVEEWKKRNSLKAQEGDRMDAEATGVAAAMRARELILRKNRYPNA